MCLAVVLDGYRASEDDVKFFTDTDLNDIPLSSAKTFEEFRNWLTGDRQQLPSLMRQCRTAIRRQMLLKTGHGTKLPLINTLPLPTHLMCYVKYEGPRSEVDLRATGGGQRKNGVTTDKYISIIDLLTAYGLRETQSHRGLKPRLCL